MKYYPLKGKNITIETGRYPVGGANFIIIKDKEGEEICVASVNLPSEDIARDEVAIKNHSENEGVLADLIELGIVSEPIRASRAGYVQVPICKLLKNTL